MDKPRVEQVKSGLAHMTSTELRRMLEEHNCTEWTPEAFEAMRLILEERGAEVDGTDTDASDESAYHDRPQRRSLLWSRCLLVGILLLVLRTGVGIAFQAREAQQIDEIIHASKPRLVFVTTADGTRAWLADAVIHQEHNGTPVLDGRSERRIGYVSANDIVQGGLEKLLGARTQERVRERQLCIKLVHVYVSRRITSELKSSPNYVPFDQALTTAVAEAESFWGIRSDSSMPYRPVTDREISDMEQKWGDAAKAAMKSEARQHIRSVSNTTSLVLAIAAGLMMFSSILFFTLERQDDSNAGQIPLQ